MGQGAPSTAYWTTAPRAAAAAHEVASPVRQDPNQAGAHQKRVLTKTLHFNVGTRYTTSGIAALVVALAPGMTLVLAFTLGVDRIRRRHVVGLAVAFIGAAVAVTVGSGNEFSFASAKGPLIVLGAPLAFALYNVILKPLLGRHDLLALTAATSLVGIVGLVPFVRRSTFETAANVSTTDTALLVYLGVVATLLGYILWNVGLRGIGPTRAVVYTYAISPLAVTMGAIALGEMITFWLMLGGVLVVGGIVLTQRTPTRRRSDSVEVWPSAPSRSAS